MSERQPLGEFLDRHTTRFTRVYSNSPEEVWRALTDPAIVDLWFIPTPAVDLRLGGRWSFVSADDPLFRGSITQYEEGRRIEYSYDNGSRMAFEVQPTGDGCTLYFDHTLPDDFVAEGNAVPPGYGWAEQPAGPGTPQPALNASWHSNLDGLSSFLAGADAAAVAGGSRRERADPEEWKSLVDAYREHIVATARKDS